MQVIIFVATFVLLNISNTFNLLIVEVKEGKLEGIKEKSVLSGSDYYSFLGIPYAKPPVGDLRFLPPVPADKWNGTYDAKKEPSACYQYDWLNNYELIGSEDCLYLNVYTPAEPSDIKIPKAVMVYIYGGAFFTGSSSSMMYSADYLINYDIILVTLNYRLHSLGFLNMGIENCPGNCGLKDQLLALKWIKTNIRQFGGDPENVTIFGISSGASAVHWHTLSPASKGLFHKAIMESGLASSAWGLVDNPIEEGFQFGRILGFEGNDPEELVKYLKKLPPKNLLDAATKMNNDKQNEYLGMAIAISFGPSIESIKDNAFITDRPENFPETVHPVPTIAGLVEKEGFLILPSVMGYILGKLKRITPDVINNFKSNELRLPEIEHEIKKNYPGTDLIAEFVIGAIKNNIKFNESHVLEIANEVKKFYSVAGSNAEFGARNLINLYSDIYFRNFYSSLAYFTNSSVPLYVYQFSFNGDLNLSTRNSTNPIIRLFADGATHGDESGYLFYPREIGNFKFKKPEISVINNMCTLWTNFAKTGNPNGETIKVEWKSYKPYEPHYLQIKQDLKLIDGRLLEKGTAFWHELEEKFK